MKTMPTRIDGELFEAAKRAGRVHSRSAAQQLDYWARLGRELEAAPGTTTVDVTRVLMGEAHYDEVGNHAQAAVRAEWGEAIATRIAGLDFTQELEATGRAWAEADDDGNLVTRGSSDTPA